MRRLKTKQNAYPGDTRTPELHAHGREHLACDKCGCTPAVLHTPIRSAGRFCAECCPHCGTASGAIPSVPRAG